MGDAGPRAHEEPVPLPNAEIISLAPGVNLQPPLSRRGHGPGMIIVVPDAAQNTAHVYDPCVWSQIRPAVEANPRIVGVVCYGSCSVFETALSSKPIRRHLAGTYMTPRSRETKDKTYEYPRASSAFFPVPGHSGFNYSSEVVSHTRNLDFVKKLIGAPYFDLEAIWEEHTYYEFENRSVAKTMGTMVQEPYVNHIPTMTGGIGRKDLTDFYAHHFIWNNPEDTEMDLMSRTIGVDRICDEFVFKFTHDMEVDWLIPGIPPTGKKLSIPFTSIVNIRGDRLYHEHIAWDQATVLVQLGLMPEYLPYPHALPDGRSSTKGARLEYRVPAAGLETARKMLDKSSISSNEMFEYKVREVAN